MSIAAFLLLFSIVVLVVGPPVLRSATHAGHLPRLGVAAWLAAMGSVLVSWASAAALALADLAHHWRHPGAVVASCLAVLRGLVAGNVGTVVQLALILSVAVGAIAVTVSTVRLVRVMVRMRSRTNRHAWAVHLVGRRLNGLDAVVIDAAEPAAYCISGRPDTVVVTSGALVTLTEPQLAAILAHEHAHLAGHHSKIVAAARGLATTFPRLKLMTEGEQHISRLLEMCADDTAARIHGSQPLLTGLLALTGAVPVSSRVLGAASVSVLARAERLASPCAAGFGRASLIGAVIAISAGGPLVTALLAASGVLVCGVW